MHNGNHPPTDVIYTVSSNEEHQGPLKFLRRLYDKLQVAFSQALVDYSRHRAADRNPVKDHRPANSMVKDHLVQ